MNNLINYLDKLILELKDLDTVVDAQLYSGEFHIKDISTFRINFGKSTDGCYVFVDYEGGDFEQNPAHPDKNFLNANFTLYVVGQADKFQNNAGFSSSCVKCCSEINRLVQHKEFHKISGACIGFSKPIKTLPALNGIKAGQNTIALHIYNYEQKIEFNFE